MVRNASSTEIVASASASLRSRSPSAAAASWAGPGPWLGFNIDHRHVIDLQVMYSPSSLALKAESSDYVSVLTTDTAIFRR